MCIRDRDLPGQLYAAVARSPYPHARILQINTQEAAALSGVRAVITGADCPTLFGSFIADQPIVAREKVRYQGEPVAAVAADTQEIAREAARLIQVEYEQLPVVNDLETSMKNEVLVHEDWSQYDCSCLLYTSGSPARDIRQRLAPLPPAAWASSSSGISSNHAKYGLMMQDFLSVPIPAGWRASCSGKPAAALYSAPQPCCSSSAEKMCIRDRCISGSVPPSARPGSPRRSAAMFTLP